MGHLLGHFAEFFIILLAFFRFDRGLFVCELLGFREFLFLFGLTRLFFCGKLLGLGFFGGFPL